MHIERHPPRRRGAEAVLVVAAALGGLTWVAGPAQAHAALISMAPANGATVRVPPTAVQLTFDEALQPRYDVVVVTAPDGTRVSVGAAQVRGRVVRQPIRPLPAAGRYTVAYRVVSADGHLVSKRLGFTYAPIAGTPVVAAPAGPIARQPAAVASPHKKNRTTGVLVVVVPGFLLLGTVLALWRRRRRLS